MSNFMSYENAQSVLGEFAEAIKSGGGGTKPKMTTRCQMEASYFEPMTWNGHTDIMGKYVWSDGENIYYSEDESQYVLDKSTSTWYDKTWNGYNPQISAYIWSDGENIYYSEDEAQYVLNKGTSTWFEKTWNGDLLNPNGHYIWTDGKNIRHSFKSDTSDIRGIYTLNKSTSTWSRSASTSIISGNFVWSDGTSIYNSNGVNNYIYTGATWSGKTWNGVSNTLNGSNIWSDGDNVYYVKDSTHTYILDSGSSTWSQIYFPGLAISSASNIWSDGENIYYSDGTKHYVLKKTKVSLRK